MAWTVPANCYYARFYGKTKTINYYAANANVPDVDSPQNIRFLSSEDANNYGWMILIDFGNGYIYTPVLNVGTLSTPIINVDNVNKTFSFDPTNYNGYTSGAIYVVASPDVYVVSTSRYKLNGFTFGNGSNILDKFCRSDVSYMMQSTFVNRTDITSATIPNGVDSMTYCFQNCTSLTSVSTIPSSVTSLVYTFMGCTSLAGEVTINANPTNKGGAFMNTTQPIVLTGNSTMLQSIANTANNGNVLVWSLSTTIVAHRDETITTNVDVSVTVTRFQGNNETLTSLLLYDNGSVISATWDDPTLTMTNPTVTFTTTLSNIGVGTTFTLSVIATDAYGSSIEVSVNIPIAFYTIDVQAGGKEIAFGSPANDDLTTHPNGLFKCVMSAVFSTGDTEIENPFFSLDTTASPGTTDGDLYAAINALGWSSDVIV